MKTVVVAVLKGGAGKSTLTAALAVRAAKESRRVAIIDLNLDQDTLGRWWAARGEPDNPALIEDFDDFAAERRRLERDGLEWLFIDTPPGAHDGLTEAAIASADVVLIPVRPSAFDLGAIAETAELCQKRGKPFALCLNAVDGRKAFERGRAATDAVLADLGYPVAETRVSYDPGWIDAAFMGRCGSEISKRLASEIEALWSETSALAEAAPRPQARRANG